MEFPGLPVEERNVLRAFKEGQTGWTVTAYQLNLKDAGHSSLVVDGHFGLQTRRATIHFQRDHFLVDDGIAGPTTCKTLCLRLALGPELDYQTPVGLARGILEGESGFDPACVSVVYASGTRDVGAWQDNTPDWDSPETLWRSFSVRRLGVDTLRKLRTQHDAYASWGCSNKVSWQLATLYHNRPADAFSLARASIGKAEINWSVISDEPGWFTIGGHAYSKREWDQKYVADKTKYVTSWTRS